MASQPLPYNFIESSMNSTNNASQTARQAPSPTSSLASGQNSMNGSMSSSIMAPLPMGHQQDLNFLYRQMQELGEILKSNRDKVNGITKAAEEVMVRIIHAAMHFLT
jgi:hypothetical protein